MSAYLTLEAIKAYQLLSSLKTFDDVLENNERLNNLSKHLTKISTDLHIEINKILDSEKLSLSL